VRTALALLLAAGVVLVGVELGKGALDEPPPKLADPCLPRHGRTGGIDATIQRVVLDGLDGAACRLHTSREELVLALAPQSGVRRRWDDHTIEVAVRAGLLRSIDAADRRGDLPGFVASLMRNVVRRAPIDVLVRGGLSLRALLP
jgi:hypothetical protein